MSVRRAALLEPPLPKLDFGLELLYGATDTRGRPDDKSEPSDVQIRGTIKHRF